MRVERIGGATLYIADVLEVLRSLPEASVHCVVTSPPYWGLRDYGIAGQLGLERTPEEYVAKMVEVFREVRRVLRPDGTCWVNLGDSYAQERWGKGAAPPPTNTHNKAALSASRGGDGLKPKDLCGIPWRVAFALQADGWYLRSDIIWAKLNPMPESVTDRPTKAHEYMFLLSKSARYFYDAEAVREDSTTTRPELLSFGPRPDIGGTGHNNDRRRSKKPDGWDTGPGGHGSIHRDGRQAGEASEIRYGRNRRTVWTIATQPFPEAHFATFPEKLVEPCILAGCPAQTCPECGAPWVRVVEKPQPPESLRNRGNGAKMDFHSRQTGSGQKLQDWYDAHPAATTGFRPTCAHARPDTLPGVVLDPFSGSGTALLVALKLGRRAVGAEIKPDYADMSIRRLQRELGMFAEVVL